MPEVFSKSDPSDVALPRVEMERVYGLLTRLNRDSGYGWVWQQDEMMAMLRSVERALGLPETLTSEEACRRDVARGWWRGREGRISHAEIVRARAEGRPPRVGS
jgi:hypothetical protein